MISCVERLLVLKPQKAFHGLTFRESRFEQGARTSSSTKKDPDCILHQNGHPWPDSPPKPLRARLSLATASSPDAIQSSCSHSGSLPRCLRTEHDCVCRVANAKANGGRKASAMDGASTSIFPS